MERMEFLEVPLFDEDLFKLVVRFGIDLAVVSWLIMGIYHRFQRQPTYVFAFFVMNVLVFFLCFSLKKLDLGLGMALGLFAIFGILRYRTDAIQIKEMTYLFVVVGIAVINALSNKKTSYAELAFANGAILLTTFCLEHFFRLPPTPEQQSMVYDKLELLRPENKSQLLADLRARTGLEVSDVVVKKIDLSSQTATISAVCAPKT